MKLLTPARLLALVPLLPASLAAQSLRGKVFDAYTQSPLSEATVVASDGGSPGTTDIHGAFTLGCRPGMVVTVRRLGYEARRATVSRCEEVLQIGLTPGTQNLNAVSVIESREAPVLEQPVSVASISRAELKRGTGLFLDDAINLTPGVRFERRTMSGGQRITIRGYGNRTNFDGSGYKAYLNGIPLTDAEGVTYLDDVDFATLGRVDVIRGPSSVLYGAGIGGVVNMFSLRPDRQGTSYEQDVLTGEDGLMRLDTRYSTSSPGSSVLINYGRQDYDSYRIHSGSRKDHASFIGDFRPNERRTISTFVGYARSHDMRAGQLDSASFFGKRNVGEAPYLNNDAFIDLESFRAGITDTYRLNAHVEPSLTAFYTGTTREDVFAVGVNPRSQQSFGGRALLRTNFGTSIPILGTTGAEYIKTNAFIKGYGLTNKVQGAITNDLEDHSTQSSVFSQWELQFPGQVTATVGASVNFIQYYIKDRLANAANPTRRSVTGRQVYDPVFVPRASLRKQFGQDFSLYVSGGQGFTPSTAGDAVIAFTGQPNDNLKPERATQLELGAKGSFIDRRLSLQLALFDLHVKDKLTSQGVFDATGTQLYSYTGNAGDQKNRGLELSAALDAFRNSTGLLTTVRPFVNVTLSDFTYDHFKSDNNNNARTIDYTGNNVVGVPKTVIGAGIDIGAKGGVYLNTTIENRDDMPITYNNVRTAPGYTLVNGKAGIARDFGRHVGFDAYVGGTNLTSELYYTMVFLNANFAAAPPAIYLPGPYSARYFGGISLKVRP